jgi:hypothetical protein
MAGFKGRFKVRGEDGKVRTYGNCQSKSQAIKKFIILAQAPNGYHGVVWRMGEESDKSNFRVTLTRIREAKQDLKLKKRYLYDEIMPEREAIPATLRTQKKKQGGRGPSLERKLFIDSFDEDRLAERLAPKIASRLRMEEYGTSTPHRRSETAALPNPGRDDDVDDDD